LVIFFQTDQEYLATQGEKVNVVSKQEKNYTSEFFVYEVYKKFQKLITIPMTYRSSVLKMF